MFKFPGNAITSHWQILTKNQAWILIASALLLEIPIRWIVRPDIPFMFPGNPWFNLPLRIAVEAGMILILLIVAYLARVPLKSTGLSWRRWTRWEVVAFVIVGSIQLLIVILVAGERWPRIFTAGILGHGLLWAFAEFLFGFNQESGFRGLLMTGLLRLRGFYPAVLINTFFFLVGPIHGPGLVGLFQRNVEGALWMMAGIIMTGLFFSWLRYRTDNLILVGSLHGIVNGFLNGAAFTLRAN